MCPDVSKGISELIPTNAHQSGIRPDTNQRRSVFPIHKPGSRQIPTTKFEVDDSAKNKASELVLIVFSSGADEPSQFQPRLEWPA